MREKKETKFTKEAIVSSRKYQHCVDYLEGNLDDDKTYTIEEIDEFIRKGGFEEC